MDSYGILLFLHVIGVILAFGCTFAFPFLQGAAERRGTGTTRFALGVMERIEKMVVLPGATLVLLFGIGLMFDDALKYNEEMPAWLQLSIGLFVIAYLLGVYNVFALHPRAHRALDNVRDESALPAAYKRIGSRMQSIGGLLGLLVIIITFLMAYKPTLWD